MVLRLGVQKAPLKRSVFKLFLKNLEATRKDHHHHGCFQQAYNSLFSSPCYMLKCPMSLLEMKLFFNLSMKEGSLFWFVVMRSTELKCFRLCSWCLWKALNERGAWGWFHDVWTCGAKVHEYWMIFSLKIN